MHFDPNHPSAHSLRSSSKGSSASPLSGPPPSSTSLLSTCQVDAPVDPPDGGSERSLPISLYLPLGCLTLSTDPASSCPASAWTEVSPATATSRSAHLPLGFSPLICASWIRVYRRLSTADAQHEVWRIFLLPFDVARSVVDRQNKTLSKSLQHLLTRLDVSESTWHAKFTPSAQLFFDRWATSDNSSLFYIFNTLPSPAPHPSRIKNRYYRKALVRMLDGQNPKGLKSDLYPYQRRAAATMLQREIEPQGQLDPRFERRIGPTNEPYYYSARDSIILRNPRMYDTVRGGILAETMGLGKTLICIAAILTTKGQRPNPPLQCNVKIPQRPKVGSLTQMAAATVSRNPIPWRTEFERIHQDKGEDMFQCIEVMDSQRPAYDIPPRIIRSMRNCSTYGPSERLLLSSSTLIVVPPNLVGQWQSELSKHVEDESLKILVLNNSKELVPPPQDLCAYDIVLFNRRRFEAENKATEELYETPLKRVHWLRIIIDEGQWFSSTSSNAANLAEKILRAERRWIVSGTPAKDLLGVEVDTPALELSSTTEASESYRNHSLEQRKDFDAVQEQSSGAVKSLGTLASRFLKARPWTAADPDSFERTAMWDEYIYRHEDYKLRTYASFSTCFRSTLESLVIKTRPFDVDRDLRLPPLKHRIIRLEPSSYDKMTANLFVLLYTANAITSERTDQDYLFHRASRGHLQRLTQNLRQSPFFWTGFSTASVKASLETAEKYLAKTDTRCTEEDRQLMRHTMDTARIALGSPLWQALSDSNEMGVFVRHWPDNSSATWALGSCTSPLAVRLDELVHAQKFVNSQLQEPNPTDQFEEAAREAKLVSQLSQANTDSSKEEKEGEKMVKNGVPSSSLGDSTTMKKIYASGTSKGSPQKRKLAQKSPSEVEQPTDPFPLLNKARQKRSQDATSEIELSNDSFLGATEMIGTASAKFSYLIDNIVNLHNDEKILIFYDGNHVAYYLSEAMDILHIKHLIYSNTLSSETRSKYIVLFNTEPSNRVLLMDIKQAAHGLNLSTASRVFFVNPPCRPDIEAQALKRAHRIGQTRPVHVETLILKGTVEEAIHSRAQKMSKREHLAAKSLEEDEGVRGIIQAANVLPMSETELSGENQMAPFSRPQQVFGRPGRRESSVAGLEMEIFGEEADEPPKKKQNRRGGSKRKRGADFAARGTVRANSLGNVSGANNSHGAGVGSSIFGG